MNECRKYKSDKIINKILENHFDEFRKKKWNPHIHPKGFRVVRRYGLYARVKNELSIEIIKLYNFIKQRNIYEIINKQDTKKMSFKERLIETF